MHKKFIRNSFTKNQKCIKTANKNAKEVKGIQENFNRHAKGMHQNFRRNSQENIAIVSKKWWKMECLRNFFWNYVAVPLHSSCTFYCIEIFSKINSNLIKHRKTFITCLSIFVCTTLTSTESEFAKTDSRIFWPSCSSKTKPNPCKPFKVLYKYATNKCDYTYNMLLCYYSFRPPHLQP